MRSLFYFLLSLLVFVSIYCGEDLLEEGKKAFAAGDYTQAIKLLTAAHEEDTINRTMYGMICLSYIYRGEELYLKTRNVSAFEGNFEKASKYLPANPSEEFNKNYSKMLVSLASAYHAAKPKTEDEKELFHKNALERVKQAIARDNTNSSADSLLAQLKIDYFQNLVDKGESLYKKAGRTGNADLYFTAEYYLKEAKEFEPENKKINDLLNKIVQKTLPVLNYREDVSLAVAGFSRERKAIIMTLSIKNYSADAIPLKLTNFRLVDRNGNKYGVNEDEMKKRELFGETCIKNTVLNQNNPSASGIIAFNAPKDANLASVNYHIGSNKVAKKLFP